MSAFKTFVFDRNNVQSLATFLAPEFDSSDVRGISFGPGSVKNVKILEIPIGQVPRKATVKITTLIDSPLKQIDKDPSIGLTDGMAVNDFYVTDPDNYGNSAPCRPVSGVHDDNRVAERLLLSDHAVMTFKPHRRTGTCYLPLDAGYSNSATFTEQLDSCSDLSLIVRRDQAEETYRFYYFIVEILE